MSDVPGGRECQSSSPAEVSRRPRTSSSPAGRRPRSDDEGLGRKKNQGSKRHLEAGRARRPERYLAGRSRGGTEGRFMATAMGCGQMVAAG